MRSWKLTSPFVAATALGFLAVQAGPTASFTINPPGNPVVGQVVQFHDTSTGSPTAWSWDFGDGQASTALLRDRST